jgi:hypothetical protein
MVASFYLGQHGGSGSHGGTVSEAAASRATGTASMLQAIALNSDEVCMASK